MPTMGTAWTNLAVNHKSGAGTMSTHMRCMAQMRGHGGQLLARPRHKLRGSQG